MKSQGCIIQNNGVETVCFVSSSLICLNFIDRVTQTKHCHVFFIFQLAFKLWTIWCNCKNEMIWLKTIENHKLSTFKNREIKFIKISYKSILKLCWNFGPCNWMKYSFNLCFQELIVDYNRYRITEFPDMEASRHSLKMVFRELQVQWNMFLQCM